MVSDDDEDGDEGEGHVQRLTSLYMFLFSFQGLESP